MLLRELIDLGRRFACINRPAHQRQRARRRLARRGVKISLWRGVMMHAKTATVDEAWSTIGSYNFDAQSRFNNLEVTVEILDAEPPDELRDDVERAIEMCPTRALSLIEKD